MPAPMPLEPPVTKATLPLNDFACICHQTPLSHLLCSFWIILSRMAVQRDSFPGCPTRSFFLSLWSSQRVHRPRKALDEATSELSAIRKLDGALLPERPVIGPHFRSQRRSNKPVHQPRIAAKSQHDSCPAFSQHRISIWPHRDSPSSLRPISSVSATY